MKFQFGAILALLWVLAAQAAPLPTIPIQFFLLGDEHGLDGTTEFAASWAWANEQVRLLNTTYYAGVVKFKAHPLQHILGEDGATYFRNQPFEKALDFLSTKYGRNDQINIFVVRNFDDPTQNGLANGIFVPLHQKQKPCLVVHGGVVTVFGSLLAHEIGHLLGLEHTAQIKSSSRVAHFDECGLRLKYPQFGYKDFWDGTEPAPIPYGLSEFRYKDWKGKKNMMSTPSLESIVSFKLPALRDNAYAPTFQQIIACWLRVSEIE